MTHFSSSGSPFGARASERQQLLTLFDLAQEVTSVLDQDELFKKIHELLGRLIPFDAFAVYLLHPTRPELRIAYPFGYPEGVAENVLVVPVTALLATLDGGYAVDVVRDGKTVRMPVQLGLIADTRVQITGGDLKEGDEVVVAS